MVKNLNNIMYFITINGDICTSTAETTPQLEGRENNRTFIKAPIEEKNNA